MVNVVILPPEPAETDRLFLLLEQVSYQVTAFDFRLSALPNNYEMNNMPGIQTTTNAWHSNQVATTLPLEARPTASQVTNGGHPSTEADLPLNNPSEPREAPVSTPVSGAATLKRRDSEGGRTQLRQQHHQHVGNQSASPRDPSGTTVRLIDLQFDSPPAAMHEQAVLAQAAQAQAAHEQALHAQAVQAAQAQPAHDQAVATVQAEHIKLTRIGELELDYPARAPVVDLRVLPRAKRLRVCALTGPNGFTTAVVLYAPNKQKIDIDDLPRCKPGT